MQVKINKDINHYQESVFIGMTLRQTVFGIAAVIVIGASYFFMKGSDSIFGSWIAMGIGVPCFMFGFVRPKKMPFEKYMMLWIRFYLLTPRNRKFIAENKYYESLFLEREKFNAINKKGSKGFKKQGVKESKKGRAVK